MSKGLNAIGRAVAGTVAVAALGWLFVWPTVYSWMHPEMTMREVWLHVVGLR